MKPDSELCQEYQQFKKIDAAFKAGDLDELCAAVDDPASVPNGPMPLTIGSCLEYAIYHSPLTFIRMLLKLGADVNPPDHAGFPPPWLQHCPVIVRGLEHREPRTCLKY